MADPTPTRDYLSHLFRDLGVVELRHQIGHRWQAGLFDDLDKLLPVARSLARQGNLFTSLNPDSHPDDQVIVASIQTIRTTNLSKPGTRSRSWDCQRHRCGRIWASTSRT